MNKYTYINRKFINNNKILPKSNWKNHLKLLYLRKKYHSIPYLIWSEKLSDRKLRRYLKIYDLNRKRLI